MTTNGQHPTAVDWATMPDFITSEEAAAESGYHANYIRRLLRQGKVKGRKFGNVWFIDHGSFQEYMQLVNKLGGHKFQGTPTIEERTEE